MRWRKGDIYRSRWHVIVTVLLVLIPFLFLRVFSRLAVLAQVTLWSDIVLSGGRLLVAYIIAMLVAWSAAVLFYRGRRATIALPFFDVLQSFPTFAALPLATIVWGASSFTVIFFLTVQVIWPMFFSIISSLKLMNREWEEAAHMAGLHGWQYLTRFILPITIPGLITGSIIGLGEGWEALVATEIIVGLPQGLGGFFQMFSANPTVTTLGIFALLSVIFSINKLLWLPLLEWSHRLIGTTTT